MKKLSILAIVFLGLAAFVYFYEIQGEESREKAKELEESLLRLEKDKIVELAIESEDGKTVRLRKEGEDWMLKEPVEAFADSSTVNGFLGSITSARRDRTLSDEDLNPADYGLDQPKLKLKVSSGSEIREVLVGNEDFTGYKVYVKLSDSPEIFLTTDSLADAMDKEINDWRSKDVLRFDRDAVNRIEILRSGDERIVLSRDEEEWKLEEPLEEPADSGAVSGLLSSLDFADIQEFIESDKVDPAACGLDEPGIKVRLREQGSEDWRILEVGEPREEEEEESYCARDPGRDLVFTVKKDLFEDLSKSVWEYRDKDVVDVGQDEVAAITVRGLEDDLKVRREDYRWIIEQPEGLKGKEVLSYKFWYPIEDIEFETIEEDEAALPDSAVTIQVELKEGGSKSFRFARKGEEYLAEKVESGRWGKISSQSFEKLQFRAEEIVDESEK